MEERWLQSFLSSCELLHYEERACQWCKEVGAVQLCEVMENWQDLAEHLRLKPAERRRLAEVSGDQEDSASSWLLPWLESLQLAHYAPEAKAWCATMGAVDCSDLKDAWEVFAADLRMDALEIHRLSRACAGCVPGEGC
ncbi:unnamed protein product [Durusdinium trenchii]|uniref:Uncharacterized protein n=1 Tax=Durusdinium trenchii TaxID=1381693 RepID=A0ABP0KDV0_9DINO